jgi:hypothetical protein
MKNISLSITDLEHRRLRIWAAQRNCSASFIVRSVLEYLPQLGRALRAFNAYNLAVMGIPSTPENQALIDLLKPIPRNKRFAQISPAKPNCRKQPAQDQAVPSTTAETKTP